MSVTTVRPEDHDDVDGQDLLSVDDSVRSDLRPGMISPEVLAVAERQAAGDRALLVRLIEEGKVVRRDGDYERRHPEVARPFVREIEALSRPKKNLAIRPKKKRR